MAGKGHKSNSQVVLVTGATSGIGAAVAEVYARRGGHLALVGRRQMRLEKVVKKCQNLNVDCKALALVADVTKAKELESAVARTLSEFGGLDTVFANAGFGVAGLVEELAVEDFRRQFETNVFGVLNTFYACFEALKTSRGRFAIVGSINSYLALPRTSPYCMSKFAVKALADSLFYEMQTHEVAVSLICPGYVESEFRQVNNKGEFRPERKDFAPSWLIMPAAKAAREMVKGVEARRREIVVTPHGKAAVMLQRHFPWGLRPVIKRLSRPHPKS